MSFRKEQHQNLKVTTDFNTSRLNYSEYSIDQLKSIWRDTLNKGIHGICFSMYEEGQKPEILLLKFKWKKELKYSNHIQNGYVLFHASKEMSTSLRLLKIMV